MCVCVRERERESWLYYNLIFVVIQTTDSDWFAHITSSLNEEMATKLQALFVTADQRRAAMGKLIILLNNNNPGIISSNNLIMMLCRKLFTVEFVSKNRTLLATIYRTLFVIFVYSVLCTVVFSTEAKKRESAGGYSFNVTAVPNAFVFSSQQ